MIRTRVFCALSVLAGMMAAPMGALCRQQTLDEKVVVTANAYPVAFENLARTVTVLTQADISRLPVRSIVDVLALATSLDVRSRAPLGLQADFSIRGSAYSQVLILVDGVRINDAQSAHHNADFPVQLQDVERIEILNGPGSALHGADAVGGIINIITRHQGDRLRASIQSGQFGLFAGSIGTSFSRGRYRQSLTASADRSTGFMYDRDFRSVSFSSRSTFGTGTSLFISHVNKEFGANGYYGPAPSKEWTNQTLISLDRRLGSGPDAKTDLQVYYRTHGDRFLYSILTPGKNENRHRTHAAGVQLKNHWSLADTLSLSLGGAAGMDAIYSSNLGTHAYARMSLFGEMQWRFGRSIVVYPGMRADYYSNFGSAACPSISASWQIQSRLRVHASIGRAFRVPTFTELYYRDPNNEGNPALDPESSWTAESGADLMPARGWLVSLTLFTRHDHNVIDWTRASSGEKWHSGNIRRFDTTGIEMRAEREFGAKGRFSAQYTHLQSVPGQAHFLSKYVLDYSPDSWKTTADFELPLALRFGQALSYQKRADGRSQWLLDVRLARRFGLITAVLNGSNLLNSRFQEVLGVDMPGLWLTIDLRVAIPSK